MPEVPSFPEDFPLRTNCIAAYLRERISLRADQDFWRKSNDTGESSWADHLSETEYPPIGNRSALGTEDKTYTASYPCDTCHSDVRRKGHAVIAPDCPVSGSCELESYSLYPERYADDAGNPIVPQMSCTNCGVQMVFDKSEDGGLTMRSRGRCLIDIEGKKFHGSGRAILNSMTVTRPEDGIESIDDEGNETFVKDDAVSAGIVAQPAEPEHISGDRACVGNVVMGWMTEGQPSEGEFLCPRSTDSGEHCQARLVVGEYGDITAVAGGLSRNWRRVCLIRRQAGRFPDRDGLDDEADGQ